MKSRCPLRRGRRGSSVGIVTEQYTHGQRDGLEGFRVGDFSSLGAHDGDVACWNVAQHRERHVAWINEPVVRDFDAMMET